MARLISSPPENSRAEWGRRFAALACILIPLMLLLVLILKDRQPGQSLLHWDNVTLSTTPPMPAADFLREIKAAGRLGDSLDPTQPGLFENLRQSCQRHDWVEQVSRVALVAPKTIQINLSFRTPVAQLRRGNQLHLIDRFGKILLPLVAEQGSGLIPLIGWDERSATDTEATSWLAQAGQLAYQLQSDLAPWQIVGIYLVRDANLDTADLRLKTKGSTFIIWQTLKGPAQDEPTVIEKQSRLRVYQERYGSLDAPTGQLLDVRVKEGLQRKPIQ